MIVCYYRKKHFFCRLQKTQPCHFQLGKYQQTIFHSPKWPFFIMNLKAVYVSKVIKYCCKQIIILPLDDYYKVRHSYNQNFILILLVCNEIQLGWKTLPWTNVMIKNVYAAAIRRRMPMCPKSSTESAFNDDMLSTTMQPRRCYNRRAVNVRRVPDGNVWSRLTSITLTKSVEGTSASGQTICRPFRSQFQQYFILKLCIIKSCII